MDTPRPQGILLIACGALAHEFMALKKANGWQDFDIICLPAELHNRPREIPAAVRSQIWRRRGDYERIFVGYGDCGTGGLLDKVLREEGVERLPGAHCYQFFAGDRTFAELADAEPGTLYLTDFLAQRFDDLIYRLLGLDRHPELRPVYFANYRRVLYLAQTENARLQQKARAAADRLDLKYEYRLCGYGDFARTLQFWHKKAAAHGRASPPPRLGVGS